MASRFQTPSVQFVDYNGRPLSFGQVFFYYSKTSTPLDTYSNQALSIINPNPITLDAFGRAGSIFLGALPYKVVLTNSQGDQVWTEDPVTRLQSSITAAGGNLTGTINFAMGAPVDAGSIGPTPPPSSIYLPAGTTFWIATVPGFTAELWGGGADNGLAIAAGAGAYSKMIYTGITPGTVFSVNVQAHGDSLTDVFTWFDSLTTQRAHCARAHRGGLASLSIGDVVFSGGDGGTGSGGGGGAAGPHGDGGNGGDGSANALGGGSGGGGGQGGGTDGDSRTSMQNDGGNGGKNFNGDVGGIGGAYVTTPGNPGGNGIHPGVGGGGSGYGGFFGGNGADDRDGGGGGGGGSNNLASGGNVGGNGGQPGGGAGLSLPETTVAIGGDGLIKITPAS